MAFKDLPINRKVMAVIMLTSVSVLLLTAAAFTAYDLFSYRDNLVRSLSTIASIIADSSTYALLFQDEESAQQNLAAVKAEPHIIAAALYDAQGNLFVRYPNSAPTNSFPASPGHLGYQFEPGHILIFKASVQGEKRAGTVYLKSDLSGFYQRLRLYSGIAASVLLGSVLVAFALSSALQKRITAPIRSLASVASVVSQRGDYSVRAQKISGDELGLLTDAFNLMLTRIQDQTVALKESEQRLRFAMEASRIGAWDWSLSTAKISWDAATDGLFGLKPGSFQGSFEAFLELIHPEDRARVKRLIGQALKNKTEYRTEFRVVWPDASIHHLAARGRAVYNEAGRGIRMSGVVLDVTESKQAELALRESEARKSAILESAIDCIITMDQTGRIVDFNPAAEKTFGYRKEDVVGKAVADVMIPERLRAAHWKGLARFNETHQGAVLGRRIEMPARRADGTEFPVELAIASTTLAGGASFFTAYLRDITERKRGEESLSFLAAIADSSDDAVIGKDLQSKVVSWNIGAERMFGYSAAEMLGQPITRLVSPDRPEEEPTILEEVKRGEIRHLETIRIRKDGQPVEVSLTVSPIKSPRGEIVGVSSIARDVTERKRAQQALERHAAVLREQAQMLDLANVLARDLEDRIILWNKGMEKMYGWTKSEALGKISHQLFASKFPQPLETVRSSLFAQGHWEGEVAHTRKDGHTIFVDSQWVLHTDAQGKPVAILEANNDVTERKRAEQRQAAFARLGRNLSAAASAPSAARVIADVANELLGWDAYSLDLYSTQDDLVFPIVNIDTINGSHQDVSPAYERESPSPLFRQVINEGAQLILRQELGKFPPYAVPFGDKTRPSASLMFVPVRLKQKVIGILSIQSYTKNAYTQEALNTLQTLADQCAGALERIRAEESVRQLNEELEQRVQTRTAELTAANQELEAFTYSVAHDLRAPLRHIDAFSRILYEDFAGELPPDAKRYLENIRSGSRNMSHLVDDLLNLARVGRQELKRQPIPLSGLVSEVLADLKRETEGRTIEWHIQPLPTVECDSGLMKQVFANLLSNAVKYTRPRPIAVIEVGSRQTNGDTTLFVRDNGVGFNMKYADKLFGVFQRLHRAEEFEGTGVGLATVDRIVRKHGGSIWAEAAEDKGATFYFTVSGLPQS